MESRTKHGIVVPLALLLAAFTGSSAAAGSGTGDAKGPPESAPNAPEGVTGPPESVPNAPDDVTQPPEGVPNPPDALPPGDLPAVPDAQPPEGVPDPDEHARNVPEDVPPGEGGRGGAMDGSGGTDAEARGKADEAPRGKARGKAMGRPLRGAGRLLAPEGAELEDAKARIDVRHFPEIGRRTERSWLRIRARRLAPSTEHSLWIDDPSTGDVDLTRVASFTTDEHGRASWVEDTRHGGTLPFDAGLADLAGLAVEVHDEATDAVVLEGAIPTLR